MDEDEERILSLLARIVEANTGLKPLRPEVDYIILGSDGFWIQCDADLILDGALTMSFFIATSLRQEFFDAN